jgi:hypothetical protein
VSDASSITCAVPLVGPLGAHADARAAKAIDTEMARCFIKAPFA